MNAWQEACQHIKVIKRGALKRSPDKAPDCSCCTYYQTDSKRDLIGVCMCDQNRMPPAAD